MVALPGQLFTNTQIPACIWFLTKNKGERTAASGRQLRNRKGEILFIDARNLGYMKDRVLRDFTEADLSQVTDTFHNWQTSTLTPTLTQKERGIKSPLPLGEDLGEGESKKKGNLKIPQSLLENARKLRQEQTDAEALIWQLLRNCQLNNAKFRRQHPVSPYILDFYCHEHKLAIELDGSQHGTNEGKEQDKKRTEIINKQGIRVIRFWNNEVFENTEGVLDVIYRALLPHPSPLPEGEGMYADIAGFCKSAQLAEIQKHDYVLTPGRYVGAVPEEDDGEPFADKMARLTGQLKSQFEESDQLEAKIKKNLAGLGFDV